MKKKFKQHEFFLYWLMVILSHVFNNFTKLYEFKEIITNQCIRLALELKTLSAKASVEDLKSAAIGLAATMGNVLSVSKINKFYYQVLLNDI